MPAMTRVRNAPEQSGDQDTFGVAAGALTGAGNQAAQDELRAQTVGSSQTRDRILNLANDYNAIPVWDRGAPADGAPATTFRTPYVLATVSPAAEAPAIKALTIAEGRPHAGERVSQAAGNDAFIGKGSPEQIQIIAQACVDSRLATPANIQTYVNNGRMRDSGYRNGKFGVDCSGFVGLEMNELEGEGRQTNDSDNAVSYRHNGGAGFTPINPANAQAGDVISYETTNHVVVVYARTEVQIPRAGGATGGATKRAIKLSIAESTASQNTANGQYVRTDRRFWYFPAATTVMGTRNNSGPEWALAHVAGDALPSYEPASGLVNYSGATDWTTGYTLNCAADPAGTNLRTRNRDGRFTVTSMVVPNNAANVELREVSGDMVRVRFNGQDELNGLTLWAPKRYVASAGAAYAIPSEGQPEGMSVSTYSVVRNPDLGAPQQQNQQQQQTGPQ